MHDIERNRVEGDEDLYTSSVKMNILSLQCQRFLAL